MGDFAFDGGNEVLFVPNSSMSTLIAVSLSLWMSQNCSTDFIPILSIQELSIGVTDSNFLEIRIKGQSFRTKLRLSLHTRTQVQFDISGTVAVGGATESIQSFPELSEMTLKFGVKLGSSEFRGLISIPEFTIERIRLNPTVTAVPAYREAPGVRPIISLRRLKEWEPCDPCNVPRFHRTGEAGDYQGKQFLACHDMCFNYQEDVLPTSAPFSYRFLHWDKTHLFIYFSHNFVTIPPPGWIDTAHINGSLCLGTIITEPGKGEGVNEEILAEQELITGKLVDIMKYYRFDGYLINIEADVATIDRLVPWVEMLRDKAKTEVGPHTVILWYDSVDVKGKVNWQSRLNEHNLPFFESSDGIFLDYHWQKDWPLESAKATNRPYQVFTGIDNYGRGTYGGGQYRCVDAVKLLDKTSIALFAPGWTYEAKSGYVKDGFLKCEEKVWRQSVHIIGDTFGELTPDRVSQTSDSLLRNWSLTVKPRDSTDWSDGHTSPHRFQVREDKTLSDGYYIVASHRWCRRRIVIPLPEVYKTVRGEVRVCGSPPGARDFFELTMEVLDGEKRVVETITTGVRETSESWQTYSLESSYPDGKFISWSEAGIDGKNWAGHFGCRFTSTALLVTLEEPTMDALLPPHPLSTPIFTWFNEGMGPAIYRRGKLLSNKPWNSISDCDTFPVYETFVRTGYEPQPYHGMTSLHIPDAGSYLLFRCNLPADQGGVLLTVTKGGCSVAVEGEEAVSQGVTHSETVEGWDVKEWKVETEGKILAVKAECSENGFVGGVHLFPSRFLREIWTLYISEPRVTWNLSSLKAGKTLVDIEIEMRVGGRQDLIRHFDILIDGVWTDRAYSTSHVLRKFQLQAQVSLFVIAETLWGSEAATALVSLSPIPS